MKILILGELYSPWTMHFVEGCLRKNGHEVWMVNGNKRREFKKYIDFYKKEGVHFIDCTKAAAYIYDGKIEGNSYKMIYGYFSIIKAIVRSGNYDLINLHYVTFLGLVYAVLLKLLKKEKVLVKKCVGNIITAK